MNYLESWMEEARKQRAKDAETYEALLAELLAETGIRRADLQPDPPPGGLEAGTTP